MKIRMLSYLPQHPELKPGVVYDLADGEHFDETGEGEAFAGDVDAKADPRAPRTASKPRRK